MLIIDDIIVTYIKENVITKLQKLWSLPRNLWAGNKSPMLLKKKKKKQFAQVIYHWFTKYSLEGLEV